MQISDVVEMKRLSEERAKEGEKEEEEGETTVGFGDSADSDKVIQCPSLLCHVTRICVM